MAWQWEATVTIQGTEKIDNTRCWLVLKPQPSCPDKVLISKETFDRDSDILLAALKPKDNKHLIDVHLKGNLRQSKTKQWIFAVSRVLEAIPNLTGLSDQEIEEQVNEFFGESNE